MARQIIRTRADMDYLLRHAVILPVNSWRLWRMLWLTRDNELGNSICMFGIAISAYHDLWISGGGGASVQLNTYGI